MANKADTTLTVDTDSATTPPDITSSPTRVAFRDFIKLADIETVDCFLAAATSTLGSENLEALWKRAYKEGFENGQRAVQPILQRVGRKMEEKFEKGVARGMDLGREEGYTVAKEAFDGMLVAIKARDTPKVNTVTTDTSAQTDPPTTTAASISVQTSPQTPNDTISTPSTLPTSSASPQHPPTIGHKKSEPLSATFESQPLTESLASTNIATASKTRSVSTNFTENYKKVENSPIFTPKPPFSSNSECFNWADDVESSLITSITSTKPPRDLSALRTSSASPFSSLRRRCRNHRKPRQFTRFWAQSNCQQIPSYARHHYSSKPQTPHQNLRQLLSTPLDWNQDPRLADLSKALRALGWVQR
jgi:hypothetical protein